MSAARRLELTAETADGTSPSIARPVAETSPVVDDDDVDGLRHQGSGEHRDQIDGPSECEQQRATAPPRRAVRAGARPSALIARRRHVRPLRGEPT